jgi:hypothetical protein
MAAFLSIGIGASVGLAPAAQPTEAIQPAPMELSADEIRASLLDQEVTQPAAQAEEIPLRDPLARSRGSLDLSMINPSLRIEYGSAADRIIDHSITADGLDANERAALGLAPSDASIFYDAVLRLEAMRLGDFALVMRSGVRGTKIDDPSLPAADAIRWGPIAGPGLEWSPGGKFFANGAALFSMDEGNGSLHEITAELGMRVTPDMSFSLGYRTLDSAFTAPSDAADELRNAAFAAIRLRF